MCTEAFPWWWHLYPSGSKLQKSKGNGYVCKHWHGGVITGGCPAGAWTEELKRGTLETVSVGRSDGEYRYRASEGKGDEEYLFAVSAVSVICGDN